MALIDGLVSYWSMSDGSGGTLTDVHGSNPGTLSGATWGTGRIGGGLTFDGSNDYVQIGDRSDLEGLPAITISAWFRWTGGYASQRHIVAKGAASNYSYAIHTTGTNRAGGRLWTASGGSHLAVDSVALINDGLWHHIVFAATENSRCDLYLDGVVSSQASSSGTWGKSTTAPVRIGGRGDNSGPWQGDIDEVGIWGRALSAGDALALYNSGAGLAYPFTSLPPRYPRGLSGGTQQLTGGLSV